MSETVEVVLLCIPIVFFPWIFVLVLLGFASFVAWLQEPTIYDSSEPYP